MYKAALDHRHRLGDDLKNMGAELLILEARSEGEWRMDETYCFQKADLDYTQCGLE